MTEVSPNQKTSELSYRRENPLNPASAPGLEKERKRGPDTRSGRAETRLICSPELCVAAAGSQRGSTRRGWRGLPERRGHHFPLGISVPKAPPLWRRPAHVKDKLPQTRNHQQHTTWLRQPRTQPGESGKRRPRRRLGAGNPTSQEAAGKPEAFLGPPAS